MHSRNLRARARSLIALAVLLSVSGCKEALIHNVSESEANRLITKLHDASIEAAKDHQPDGKWSVQTSSSDAIRALQYLDEVRVLRSEPLAEAPQNSLLATREDKKLQAERLLARELESSLGSIDGVLEAHVHLNLPPVDPLFGARIRDASGSASAILVLGSESTLERGEISQIIAGATGVDSKSISVLISHGAKEAMQQAHLAALSLSSPAQARELPPGTHQTLLWVGVSLLITGISTLGYFWQQQRRARSSV